MSMTKDDLLKTLKTRFENYTYRHKNVTWSEIENKLKNNESLLETVLAMEESGGEPDVTTLGGKLVYVDFSKETPKNRRNNCYDEEARLNRKNFPPDTSVELLCQRHGYECLDETLYYELQKVEPLDQKTSTWLKTPADVRERGGALFADRRYGRVFTYHNGADSYYGSRSFRAYVVLK
jgi:hypothetical protein